LTEWLDFSDQKQLAGSATKDFSVSVLDQILEVIVVGVLIPTGDAVVVQAAAEVKVPTAIEEDGSLEGVEHRLVDVRAEIDAGFEVDFAVQIAVQIDAGDAAGSEVDFVVVEIGAGDDAEFGLEEVVETLMEIVTSKFVFGVEDAQLQHTWIDSH
jgi:hypothetical protein